MFYLIFPCFTLKGRGASPSPTIPGEHHGAVKIQGDFDDSKLDLLQEDQSSPLFAMTTFEELGLYAADAISTWLSTIRLSAPPQKRRSA